MHSSQLQPCSYHLGEKKELQSTGKALVKFRFVLPHPLPWTKPSLTDFQKPLGTQTSVWEPWWLFYLLRSQRQRWHSSVQSKPFSGIWVASAAS
jgi:hypothetical protein